MLNNHESLLTVRRPWYANVWLQVVLVASVAAFFRLWQIASVPPGLFGDEATDGLDALDVLAGRGAVFFPANFGREGLHMWIIAGMFRLMGVVPLAVRLPSVLAGIVTVLATYWLAREMVRTQMPRDGVLPRQEYYDSLVPLLAALYTATSYWHVHFSRFGIRGVFTPMCGALAFAAFWRAVNVAHGVESSGFRVGGLGTHNSKLETRNSKPVTRNSLPWFALSGFFLGLSMHFYTASRFLPLFLGGYLVLQGAIAYATGRRQEAILRRSLAGVALLFVVAALVFAPLGVYFLQHPGSFAQRASVVATAGSSANPPLRMAQAALANAVQFFVPGRGDESLSYNLPYRSVFDPLTAVLALLGIAVLLRRWRIPAALFLLTWWPAMLLPCVLAIDRFPTLPRALGVIPGVYFFPAVGLVAVAACLAKLQARARASGVLRVAASMLVTVSLCVHAGLTYRDYFRVWAPAQLTFDGFDGDMVAAWQWLRSNEPMGHIYLSADIYRHPTFMLLGEHATVTAYFEHANPKLSWFEARGALPLPPAGQGATYLITAGSPVEGRAAAFLATYGTERGRVLAPDGSSALRVIEAPVSAGLSPVAEGRMTPIALSERLSLSSAVWQAGAGGKPELWLEWCTVGPEPAELSGYRLELRGGDATTTAWMIGLPWDAFRPSEWAPSGCFITWHRLERLGPLDAAPREIGLRLVRLRDEEPVVASDAPDGWRSIEVKLSTQG